MMNPADIYRKSVQLNAPVMAIFKNKPAFQVSIKIYPALTIFKISPSSGNRPSFFLEKISLPSISTSNTPPEDSIRSDDAFSALFSSSARPAARGL
jgi:hypothetical protein